MRRDFLIFKIPKWNFMKIKTYLAALSFILLNSTAVHASNLQKAETKFVVSHYAKTQYPIVFAHGMVGFNRIGFDTLGMDYWYQILPDLARNGSTAFAARMSPFNSSEVRGEQYVEQLKEVMAITGAKKLNLIGHSHGAHAVRYAAGVLPENVASVMTVGGANQGTIVASDVMQLANQTGTSELLNTIISSFGNVIMWAQGLDGKAFPHNALAAGHSTSIEGTAEFNQRFTWTFIESMW
jgi:triacylglycerol lipase